MASGLSTSKGSGNVEKSESSVAPQKPHPLRALPQSLDVAAIRARYELERVKRASSVGVSQFRRAKGELGHMRADVVEPVVPRDPITRDLTVLIVGAGLSGLITAVNLKRDYGVTDFVVIDKAGGFGGTWYWNQYPGVACDTESFIYLPFLEETGYVPQRRFSIGPEVREHVARVVDKWELQSHAHLHTEITSMHWDEPLRRWHVRTNHRDHFVAQFVVLAAGSFHEMKLPGLEGLDTFQGPAFHSSRWDYDVTGGSAVDWSSMDKLADKVVGVIGTGCSAVQLVPELAGSAKKVIVFQRTPSSITLRENTPTSDMMPAVLDMIREPGWQRARMEEFANILQGGIVDHDVSSIEGLEVRTVRALVKEAEEAGTTLRPEEIPELLQLADLRLMDRIRRQIDDMVHDRSTAESLKPWYHFMCKRPAFSNDYLLAFNRHNVQLVDTEGRGVTRLTATGVVANGVEHPVDVVVFSTGFSYETDASFGQRTGIELIGTRGRTFDEATRARGGPATLFGIHLREFPNLFNIGPAQAGVAVNWTLTASMAAEHIAATIAAVLDLKSRKREDHDQAEVQRQDEDVTRGVEVIEPTEDAAEAWGKQTEEGKETRLQFAAVCPPGYFNRQGEPAKISPRSAFYPKGIMEWQQKMREWRAEGNMMHMDKR